MSPLIFKRGEKELVERVLLQRRTSTFFLSLTPTRGFVSLALTALPLKRLLYRRQGQKARNFLPLQNGPKNSC
jgi:hypothetical protein